MADLLARPMLVPFTLTSSTGASQNPVGLTFRTVTRVLALNFAGFIAPSVSSPTFLTGAPATHSEGVSQEEGAGARSRRTFHGVEGARDMVGDDSLLDEALIAKGLDEGRSMLLRKMLTERDVQQLPTT